MLITGITSRATIYPMYDYSYDMIVHICTLCIRVSFEAKVFDKCNIHGNISCTFFFRHCTRTNSKGMKEIITQEKH